MLTSHDTVFLNSNTNAAEGQDKDRQSGDRPATKQVYRETAAFRSNRFAAQSDERDNDLNALVPLTIQCKRYVKEEIHAIAKERSRKEKDKVSDSAVGADFLEWIVHHRENLRRSRYAEATLTKLFDRMYTEFSNRFLGLTARNTYNLHLVLSILFDFVPLYVGEAKFEQMLKNAASSSRIDIIRQSPQVQEVFNALKQEVFGRKENG